MLPGSSDILHEVTFHYGKITLNVKKKIKPAKAQNKMLPGL